MSARVFGASFKNSAWLSLFLLVFTLASCGGDDTQAGQSSDSDTASEAQAQEDVDAVEDSAAELLTETSADASQAEVDAQTADEVAGDPCAGMAAACILDVEDFGSLFGKSNGRADGTLLALVGPTDEQCALFNGTHVVLQLSILGHVQRLVVSVDEIRVLSIQAPLIGPAFEEGWHVDQHLDYADDLGVHSEDFAAASMDEAVAFVCSELELGAPVSVFAYASGEYPASAHQIHRNDKYPDGAVVARPDSDSPLYLLFRYDDQVF